MIHWWSGFARGNLVKCTTSFKESIKWLFLGEVLKWNLLTCFDTEEAIMRSPERFVRKKHIVPTGRRRVSYARVVIGVGFVWTRDHSIDTCDTWRNVKWLNDIGFLYSSSIRSGPMIKDRSRLMFRMKECIWLDRNIDKTLRLDNQWR